MLQNSQRAKKWANELIGTSKTETISKSGCYLTCISNWLDKTPSEVNKILTEKKAYVNGCLIEGVSVAKALGMEYLGRTSQKPLECEICICETDAFRPQVKSHFFLFRCADGFILDPWDISPKWRDNNYHIVSYRLFSLPMPDNITTIIDLLGELWAKNPEKQTQIHEAADKLRALRAALGLTVTK